MLTNFSVFQELPFELRLRIWELALPGPRIVEVFIKGHLLTDDGDKSEVEDERINTEPPSELARSSLTPAPEINEPPPGFGTFAAEPVLFSTEVENGSSTFHAEEPSEELEGDLDSESNAESDYESEGGPREVDPARLNYISSSPVPSLLHACQESREVALQTYALQFGTLVSPPKIYFSNSIDTLYFPYWSFENGSSEFVDAVTEHEAFLVQHVAFDIDKWFMSWNDDHINYQIEPLKFPQLKEITFLHSLPHPDRVCSCCEEPERPKVLGNVGFVEADHDGDLAWNEKIMAQCKEALDKMEKEYPDFRAPVIKVMSLTRNGVKV